MDIQVILVYTNRTYESYYTHNTRTHHFQHRFDRDVLSKPPVVLERIDGTKSRTISKQTETTHDKYHKIEHIEMVSPGTTTQRTYANINLVSDLYRFPHKHKTGTVGIDAGLKNTFEAAVCPEGKNNNKSGNYEYLKYNGAKNVTRGKFKKQCGTSSHESYIRHATASRRGLARAQNLASDFSLHTAPTLKAFEHSLRIKLSPKVFRPMNNM